MKLGRIGIEADHLMPRECMVARQLDDQGLIHQSGIDKGIRYLAELFHVRDLSGNDPLLLRGDQIFRPHAACAAGR